MASAVHEDDKNPFCLTGKNAALENKESYSEYRFVKPDGTILSWVATPSMITKSIIRDIER
jgi:hypothetical protein